MSKKKPLPETPIEVRIESLTHDGRGLTHVDGKAVFVQGALEGERVLMRYTRLQKRYDEAVVTQVLEPSPQRVEPRCPHFGVCGGCSLQHLEATAQIGMKQEILKDVLARIGRVAPETWLEPLAAGHWGYRRKARLGVKYVAKKGRVLVGFRERAAAFITDLTRCETLHPMVGERIGALSALVQSLSIRDQIPQIEVAMGDGPCVLIFRVLTPPRRRTWGCSRPLPRNRGCTSISRTAATTASVPCRGRASTWPSASRRTAWRSISSPPTSPRSIWNSTASWWTAPWTCST